MLAIDRKRIICTYDKQSDACSNRNLIKCEDLIHKICSFMLDAIIALNNEGCITFWNDAAEKLFGYTPDEFMLKPFEELIVRKEYIEKFSVSLEEFRAAGEESVINNTIEMSAINRDQEVFPIELSISSIKDGDIKVTLAIIKDISARKRVEEEKDKLWHQLVHSQKMEPVGRLTGSIAHDFNNMLTGILGYSELALCDLEDGHEAVSKIKSIKRAGEKAVALTQQLLAFSRKQVLSMKLNNLNIIIDDMSRILARVIGEDVKLICDIKDKTSNIMADEAQIEQVLMNLAVNARQAMPNGGTVTINTKDVVFDEDFVKNNSGSRVGKYVMLSVKDTGVGIQQEMISKIFEPYFTTKGEGEGTGLGLSTVYGIIKQHNGYITVESSKGNGAEFKIYLPVVEGDMEKIGKKEPKDNISLLKGTETVLIVDDNLIARSLIVDTLKGKGYNVLSAESGEEALAIIRDSGIDIDLLFTDVVMEGMNGPELYKEAKRGIPDLKVIFTSGYAGNPLIYKEIYDFDLPFIKKPFSPSSLLFKIREVIQENSK